jgi:Putative prokaryotic signal transducing protein
MSSMGFGAAGLFIAIALVLWAMMRPRKAHDRQADLCELVRTNNTVLISAIEAVLAQAEIPHLVLDQNMSVLEGSLGVLPRRVLVHQRSLAAARGLLADAGLGHELNPDAG